jgi:hypothetical protein
MVQLLSFHNQSRVPFIFQCILNIEIPMIPRISQWIPWYPHPFFQSPTVAFVYLPEPWFLRIRDATWPTSCWTNPDSHPAAAWSYGSPGRKARDAKRPLGKMGGFLIKSTKNAVSSNIDLCPKSKITKRKWGFQNFSFKTWGFEWQRWWSRGEWGKKTSKTRQFHRQTSAE